MTEDIYFRLFL